MEKKRKITNSKVKRLNRITEHSRTFRSVPDLDKERPYAIPFVRPLPYTVELHFRILQNFRHPSSSSPLLKFIKHTSIFLQL
jgi:hypothetical protein